MLPASADVIFHAAVKLKKSIHSHTDTKKMDDRTIIANN